MEKYMKRLFEACKKLIVIDNKRKALMLERDKEIEKALLKFGFVKWYNNTWRIAGRQDRLEGFTLDEIVKIIDKAHKLLKEHGVYEEINLSH